MFSQGDKVVIADLDGYHAWYTENVPNGAFLAGNLCRAVAVSVVKEVQPGESRISEIGAFVPNQFLRLATIDDPKPLNLVADLNNPRCPLCGKPAITYPYFADYDGVSVIPAVCDGGVHYWSWRVDEMPSTCDEDTQPIIVDEVDTLLLDDLTGEG